MEKELHELRERSSKVEEWKQRRKDIEDELNKVWVAGKDQGGELEAPEYVEEREAPESIEEREAPASESLVEAS